MLPMLAVFAIAFSPAVRLLHERFETAHAHHVHDHSVLADDGLFDQADLDAHFSFDASPAIDVSGHADASHSHPPHERVPHDDAHCSLCATISTLKHVTSAALFVLSLTSESAATFDVPAYLCPTTSAPVLTQAAPRGPPAAV